MKSFGRLPSCHYNELFEKLTDYMGIRKFVHFLCEAEAQSKKESKSIMGCFASLLHVERLISWELKSLLEKAMTKSSDKSVISNYSSILAEQKSRTSVHNFKSTEFEKPEINIIDPPKNNKCPKEDDRGETFDKTLGSDEIACSQNLQAPLSSYEEKLVSEYSGELSESFHDNKKVTEHSEYKILINEHESECKEFRSQSFFKLDHSVSEKDKNVYDKYLEKKMHISMVDEGKKNAVSNSSTPHKEREKKLHSRYLIFKT